MSHSLVHSFDTVLGVLYREIQDHSNFVLELFLGTVEIEAWRIFRLFGTPSHLSWFFCFTSIFLCFVTACMT